ncbi:hypothetical protein MTO96_009794 [Rhipicephalus appendiculatus]
MRERACGGGRWCGISQEDQPRTRALKKGRRVPEPRHPRPELSEAAWSYPSSELLCSPEAGANSRRPAGPGPCCLCKLLLRAVPVALDRPRAVKLPMRTRGAAVPPGCTLCVSYTALTTQLLHAVRRQPASEVQHSCSQTEPRTTREAGIQGRRCCDAEVQASPQGVPAVEARAYDWPSLATFMRQAYPKMVQELENSSRSSRAFRGYRLLADTCEGSESRLYRDITFPREVGASFIGLRRKHRSIEDNLNL